MDILSPWLGATIESELGQVLQYRGIDSNRTQSIGRAGVLSYEDDGSNLRIKSDKKGPVLQISKFLTHEEPIQVVLSDSVLRVTANIAKNASKRYFHKTRQNFTEGTLGGLIQLLDFEIVATHLGPRPQKITLLVKDFQGLGSNGMGEVGMAPQAIESREETKALLEMLKEFRDLEKSANHQTRSSQERSISESLLVSQVGSNPPSEDNYMNSQAEFATQAPRRATVPLGSKANPIEANINTDVSSHAIVNDSRTSTTSFEPAASEFDVKKLGKTIFTDQRPTLTQHSLQRQNVNRSKGPVNSASDLLGLIQNVNRVPISTVSTRGGNTEVEGRRHRKTPIIDSAQGVESTGDVTMPTGYINELVSRENLSPAVGADAIKISTMSKKRKRLIQENEKRKVEDDAMFSLVEHNMNLTAGEGAKPELAQQYEWMSKTSPVSAGSQFIDHPLNSTTPTSAAPPLWAPAEPFVLRHVAPAANRISDAEVKISKDQEALLNSPNSWVPAEPGNRDPRANVPISKLKLMNQAADLHAQRLTRAQERRRNITRYSSETRRHDSESDAPVSSGQWPPSPESNQLPPDSSIASVDHSEGSIPQTAAYSPSRLLSRRSSHVSVLSGSMSSARPRPIVKPGSLTDLAVPSPGIVSSSNSSPSIVSTSAGEDGKPFRCRRDGCNKAYTVLGSLQRHVKNHHTGMKAGVRYSKSDTSQSDASGEDGKPFRCRRDGCNKAYTVLGSLQRHVKNHHKGMRAGVRYSKSGTSQSDASGASTPLFPNLFPREEGNITSQRGGGSGPSNGLDEPESRPGLIRVSTFDSIDGGAKHKEHATFLDHHPRSISAILDPTFLPDMIQSVSTSANETPDVGSSLKDKQSRSVSLESDLELTVPTPLNQGKPPYAASVLPQEPFTQVKRTPYANGHLHEDPLDWSRSQSSPLRPVADCHSGALADNVGCVKLSLPSASEISSVKSRDNQRNEVIVESQKDLGDRTFSMSDEQTKPQTKLNNSRPHGLGNHSRIPKTMKTLIDGGKDAPQQPTTSQNIVTGSPVSGNREMKRKVFDGSFGFPDVVKRRKRFEILTAFNLAADPDSRRDPTEGARQFRQEFLASRRSSESSNPRESPTITSPVGSSWTIPALKNQEVEMRDKSRELHLQDSSTVPNYEVEHTIYKEALSTGDQEPQPTEIDTESTVPGSSIVAASFSSKYLGAPLDVQGPTSPGHRHDVLLHETQDRENIKVPTPSPSDVGPVGLESTEALPRLLNPVSPGHSVDIPMPETQDLNEQIESTVSKLPNTDPVGLETSDALPRVQDPPFSDKIADVPMPDTQERGEHVESTIKALISVKPADSETDEALPGAQNHTFPDHHSLIFNSDAKDQVADMDSSDFSTAKHPSPADVLDLRTIGILPSAQDSTSPILNATSTVSLVKDQVENLSSPPPTSPLLEEKSNPETNDAPSGAQNHISHNDGADDDVFDAEDQTEMTHPSISTFAHVMNFIDLETSGTLPVAQNSASLDHSVDMSISNAQNRIEVTPTVITFPNAEGTSAAEIPDVQVNTSASHSADYTPSGARDEIVLDNPEDVMTPVEITSCSPGLDVQRAQSVELVLSAHQKNQEGINMDHRSLQAEDGSTVEYEAKLSRITSGPNQVPDIHLDDELHDQQHPVGDANIFSEDAPGQGCNAPTLELPSILSLEPGTSVSGPHPQSLRSVNVGIDILMTEGKPNEAIRPLLEIKPSLPHEEQPISQVRPVLPKSPEQPPVNSPSVEECTSLNFDLPKANPRATEEREQPATVSVEQDAQKHSGTARNIFDKFKAAYPDYSGDQKHFIAICKKISILLNANRMEHPSLWDDFIVRHKMDYSRHLRRCVELAEDALPYEEFYRDKIEEPQYQKRVVTRCNLEEVLSLADSYLGPIKRATKPIDHTKPQQPVVKQISRREIPKTTTQNPVEMRVTIDLTEDDQEIEDNEMPERAHIASPACTNTKVRRPLPWVEPINGNRVPAVQASLGSLHGEPFAGHFDAKISKVNCLGAETPHCNVSTDSSVLSKTNTLSKLPIEAKGFLNQQRNQERIQANITGDIAQGALRPSNGKPTTFAEQIETSWGVRADSVLQPKHYDVDTLTPRVMELLAEISLMTDVVEARNMIKMQIRTHSWKTGHGQKIRPEYLEAVKSNLKTRQRSVDSDEQGHEDRTSSKSSMRTTGPSSLPQASVAIEQMDDGMPSGWWKDGNTPFKTFARAYASIQNGNGNSFAKPNSAEKGHAGRTQRVGSDGTELRKIDILRWKLERY